MKILILYASTGNGHKMAAKSINESLKELYPKSNVKSIDLLKSSFVIIQLLYFIYLQFIKCSPKIWSFFYNNIASLENFFLKNELFKKIITFSYFFSLRTELKNYKPDFIITTSGFPFLHLIDELINKYSPNAHKAVVVTDFRARHLWYHNSIEYYFVGSKEAYDDLINLGVKPSKIFHCGIPVDKKFFSPNNFSSIKHNRAPNSVTIMIMFGGLGMGPIFEVTSAILERLNKEVEMIIVTGQNSSDYKKIRHQITHKKLARVKVFSFSHHICDIMNKSTILVTKPGGISASEAIVAKLPMVLYDSLGGQESDNLNFLLEKGVAIKANTPKEVASSVYYLMNNNQLLTSMRIRTEFLCYPGASYKIAEHIHNICQVTV